MKKLFIVTSTRAEFGLLNRLTNILDSDERLDVSLVVTGAHFSHDLGNTVEEVRNECKCKMIELPIEFNGDDVISVSSTMATTIERFTELFHREKPDCVVLLGDRYEIFAVAAAASLTLTPIAHLYGGETTEGALDEAFRHSITKMSHLHFTATEDYRKRVVQLGESPDRVFCVGSTGIENIETIDLMSKDELEKWLDIDLSGPYAVGTYHPVTMEGGSAKEQCMSLIDACSSFPEITFIFTKANADTEGAVINQYLEEATERMDNIHLVASMGFRGYLSSLKYCDFVIGNSSSGIVEAPSFCVPTVNIGIRQKGRTQAESIINCDPEEKAINAAITRALKMKCDNTINPYKGERPSETIAEVICDHALHDKIDLCKSFYDLP